MTPDEMQDLAKTMAQVPGLKGIEFREIRRLAQLLREQPEIGSIELKGFFGTGVVITRTSHGAPQMVHALPGHAPLALTTHAPAPVAHAQTGDAPAANAPSSLTEIRSPMVGTFYAQPEPGVDPYARVGTRVSPGQTVCIIEAMKIMNEIEAEVTGIVREVCVTDGSPVEYGQVLFRVDPHG